MILIVKLTHVEKNYGYSKAYMDCYYPSAEQSRINSRPQSSHTQNCQTFRSALCDCVGKVPYRSEPLRSFGD